MEFGVWVQSIRRRREMDVRAFAHLTGVDASTISRLEQARSQVTLCTAVRICEGVEMTPADLLLALRGKRPQLDALRQMAREGEVVTISDLEALLLYMHHHWHEGCAWLASLLNQIASRASGEAQLFVAEDITKLLQDSRLYQFEIHYPEEMKAEAIWRIYLHGGALSLVDIGVYIKQVRRTRRLTLSALEESGKVSASVLSRLETGVMERIKLVDVLALDEYLGQEGRLVAMYWRACALFDAVGRVHHQRERAKVETPASIRRIEQARKVTELFMMICRWLSSLSPPDQTFAAEVRTRFHHALTGAGFVPIEDTHG